ncbi:MAG: tetraacyldisaccharide 4-kinase [Bacteroidota bacterium]
MHFNNIYLRSFRLFLFPLTLLYGLAVRLRNYLYTKKVIEGIAFNIPVFCVGNLSVGGTGKSPMVDYMIGLLKRQYPVATISRGYKRRTSGYVLAGEKTTAIEIGDEPMQFHLSHPDVAVSVCEKRIEAVPELLFDRPETKVIILDDAFQHREIQAGLQIILTEYNNLYTRDMFLPAGDLRDQVSSANRADVIIVTKCPPDLSEHGRFLVLQELSPAQHQQVFFTSIQYGIPHHIIHGTPYKLTKDIEVLLICGIANPTPLTSYVHDESKTYDALFYNDHHLFSIDDVNEIKYRFDEVLEGERIILTTGKDAVRLTRYKEQLESLPFYVLPISVHFLFGQASEFDALVLSYPMNFYKSGDIPPEHQHHSLEMAG